MNALRTLPILNRPSRPASPAPPSTHTATATAQPPTSLGLGIMHTASEPGKPRSRSLSRHVTDKIVPHATGPAGATGLAPSASANGFVHPQPQTGKRTSPPASRAATPRLPQTPLPVGAENGAAPQSGYMDVLGLRLNEVVNKACVGVDFKAKKGFKKDAGWIVGESVIK